MSLMLSLFAVTAACTPTAKPAADNVAVIEKLFTAIAANDEATIGALLKPGARMYATDETIIVRYHGDDAENVTSVSFSQEGGCVTEMRQVD